MYDGLDDECDSGYAAKLGARLRSLCRQQQLFLQEVEAVSDHEFRASVLGAYERGERTISLQRLQRLARCYRVPVDQMVPSDHEPDSRWPASDDQVVDRKAGTGGPRNVDRPVTIDLAAAEQLARPEGDMLARYLRAIEVRRGDCNGRMLTIRGQDLTAMACIFGCRPEQVPAPARRPGRPPSPLTRRRSRRPSHRAGTRDERRLPRDEIRDRRIQDFASGLS